MIFHRGNRIGGVSGTESRPFLNERLNVVMETKGGRKKSSSSCPQYETPLGYKIEDVRPNGGIEKFRSAAYSNCVRKPS